MDASPRDHPTGYDRLPNPRLNTGMAFTMAERKLFNDDGPAERG